eukprot:m.110303 g.110303  ORF g.110303 m.110303 type:complete len:251 (-) comp28027_c0_seq2:145-897(-)
MYFPRGTVHQAVSADDEASHHLTFSTYQRHTWFDLISDAVGSENQGMMMCFASEPGGIHTDLPITLIDKVNVAKPKEAWNRHKKFLKSIGLNSELLKFLKQDGVLGGAIDAYAVRFLRDSLPPPPSPPLHETSTCDSTTKGSRIRLKHKRSVWLAYDPANSVVPSNDLTCDIVLHTNRMNGRSLKDEASPCFQVMPCCVKAVTMLIEVDPFVGCKVQDVLNTTVDETQERDDLEELLETLGGDYDVLELF